MQPKTLRFRAVGMALVQDLEALGAGIRKYVGREAQDANGGPVTAETTQVAWVPTSEPATVAFRQDYVAACKSGDLEPADAETAKACGVELKTSDKTKKTTTSEGS